MKFLSNQELTNALQSCSISEITSFKQRVTDFSEDFAIEVVKSYLINNFDMEHELRPYQEFEHSKIYQDGDRIRITSNQDNQDFVELWDISLIDTPLYTETPITPEDDPFYSNFDPLDDSPVEEFLVVKHNTCYPQTIQKPIQSFINGVENYETVPNPLYNQYCGIITCSDSVINSGYITNHYTKFYDTETNLITDINFGDISSLEANSYLNNLNNFEQYLLINKERDFNKDDRNVILKQLILDIFTYNLIQRIHPRQISETIIERYTTAIETLRQIQRGDISINLKKYEGTEFQNNMSVRWGISKSGMRNSF